MAAAPVLTQLDPNTAPGMVLMSVGNGKLQHCGLRCWHTPKVALADHQTVTISLGFVAKSKHSTVEGPGMRWTYALGLAALPVVICSAPPARAPCVSMSQLQLPWELALDPLPRGVLCVRQPTPVLPQDTATKVSEAFDLKKYRRYEVIMTAYNIIGESPASTPVEVFVGEAAPAMSPAERAGDPAHGQPAGGHVGPTAPGEPEWEHPRLQDLLLGGRQPERHGENEGPVPPRARGEAEEPDQPYRVHRQHISLQRRRRWAQE
ncbi:hypothetical protein H8959_007524 [Pygathrix nigripes]